MKKKERTSHDLSVNVVLSFKSRIIGQLLNLIERGANALKAALEVDQVLVVQFVVCRSCTVIAIGKVVVQLNRPRG